MFSRRPSVCLFRIVFLACFLPIIVHAQSAIPTIPTDRAVAIGLAREGRCEVALPELTAIAVLHKDDGEAQQLLGECALNLQQFGKAAAALETARQIDPSIGAVDLHLAMAYFHSGELGKAVEALARVEVTDSQRPEFLLYSGMLALAQTNYDVAVGRLRAASQLEDGRAEPMASFYLGRAHASSLERDEAVAAFERVIRDSPETVWAEEAERAIEAVREEEEIKVWGSLEIGFEHDGNALLLGQNVPRPSEIARDSDQRGFWFVDVGALLFQNDDWSAGAALRYGGSKHHELERFDAHSPGGTIWVDKALGVADASLRLQADFDATWIGADPFLLSHLWSASLFKPRESAGYTSAKVSVGLDDFRYTIADLESSPGLPPAECVRGICGPIGLNEKNARDRDGRRVTVSLLHRVPIPSEVEWLVSPWIEGKFAYSHYTSEGTEYDHERNQVELTAGVQLPLEIQLRVSGRYAYVPFGNPSTFPDPSNISSTVPSILGSSNRREHEAGVRIRLERAFGEHVVLSTRWSRTRNYSNVEVFDYSRDLFGVSLRIALGG